MPHLVPWQRGPACAASCSQRWTGGLRAACGGAAQHLCQVPNTTRKVASMTGLAICCIFRGRARQPCSQLMDVRTQVQTYSLFRVRPSLVQYTHARFHRACSWPHIYIDIYSILVSYRLTCVENASPFFYCCDAQIRSFRNRNGKRRHEELWMVSQSQLPRNWPWS